MRRTQTSCAYRKLSIGNHHVERDCAFVHSHAWHENRTGGKLFSYILFHERVCDVCGYYYLRTKHMRLSVSELIGFAGPNEFFIFVFFFFLKQRPKSSMLHRVLTWSGLPSAFHANQNARRKYNWTKTKSSATTTTADTFIFDVWWEKSIMWPRNDVVNKQPFYNVVVGVTNRTVSIDAGNRSSCNAHIGLLCSQSDKQTTTTRKWLKRVVRVNDGIHTYK